MTPLNLGPVANFTQMRYTLTLPSSKQLVLFRLPRIARASPQPPPPHKSSEGWVYYCMEAVCPHSGGPMENATIDIEDGSYIASCPWHSYDFNVDTGESSYGIKACTFPVHIRNGEIYVDCDDGTAGTAAVKVEPVSEKIEFNRQPDPPNPQHTSPLSDKPVYLPSTATLCEWCVHILNTSNPEHKILLTHHLYTTFIEREPTSSPMPIGAGLVSPPDEPPRSKLNSKVQPWEVPKPGRGGTLKSRIAMLHALANIEQWAIDLAIDIMVRFAAFRTIPPSTSSGKAPPMPLPRAFFQDWLRVASDEAKHFSLLRSRLTSLSSSFGALPVHHSLWSSAAITSHDLRARISIIALVHEARGLDVNPMTIKKFEAAGDQDSVEALTTIHRDEITHVTAGHRWLTWICEMEGADPVEVFRGNVRQYFRGAVKGPFNDEARRETGMEEGWYRDLGGGMPVKAGMVAGG